VRIAGAGHNYLVAAPDAANQAVLDFTREVMPGRRRPSGRLQVGQTTALLRIQVITPGSNIFA